MIVHRSRCRRLAARSEELDACPVPSSIPACSPAARRAARSACSCQLVRPAVPQHRLAGRDHRRRSPRSSGIWSPTPTGTWRPGTSPPASASSAGPPAIPIGEHLIPYDPAVSTYGRALLIGMLNTLKVAVVGVVLATILGTLIGIARLSRNWLRRQAGGGLRRGDPRHPGAAAAAVLVRAAAEPAGAAPGAATRCRACSSPTAA